MNKINKVRKMKLGLTKTMM